MIRRPPRSTQSRSSAASDVYKRQILCSVCEETVRLRLDPENESEAKSVVVTLSLGAAIVAVVAFINLIGDAGFPAYYVAILFLLISTMILSNQSSKTLELELSLIHISEPTRRTPISYAVFCLKK